MRPMGWPSHRRQSTPVWLAYGQRPSIFTALIMEKKVVHLVAHYLDALGPPHSPQCSQQLHGHPLGGEQMRGPPHVPRMDSTRMEIRLPADKLHRLRQLRDTRTKSRAQRESCCPYLQHASKAGPLFLTEADHTFHSAST